MRTGKIKDGYGTVQKDVMKADISVYAKAVYCLLTTYAGGDGLCYPSLKTICSDLKISKPTVIKGIKDLIGIGFLVADKRKTILGENECNVYYPLYIMDEKVVKDIDNPVKRVYDSGKSDLPPVVNDVDTKINSSKINIEDNNKGDLFNGFGLKEKKAKEKLPFKKPELFEVQNYFEELGYLQLATEFRDHYVSNGWMVGKTKMQDWNAAARSWVRRHETRLQELALSTKANPGKITNLETLQTNWDKI